MTQNYGMPSDVTRHVWEVTKVEDAFGPTSLGGSNRMKRVWFKMADDTVSYVDVPDTRGWPSQASADIEQAVQDHIQATSLKSIEKV